MTERVMPMMWLFAALVVGLAICVIALLRGARTLDTPLSEEWRAAHVADHGDGELPE